VDLVNNLRTNRFVVGGATLESGRAIGDYDRAVTEVPAIRTVLDTQWSVVNPTTTKAVAPRSFKLRSSSVPMKALLTRL
jgi:hypothetical protein